MDPVYEVVANVDNVVFDVEVALELQLGAQPLPFPGMDKSGAAVCIYYQNKTCAMGQQCPFRHLAGEKLIVCKHWLRGLCKKGDQCEFLHEYNLAKMPECYFFSKYNACSNKECPFRHVDPESKIKDCAWYDRGMCRNGPSCKNRHRRRVMCISWMNGFCPEGKTCKQAHPAFDIPVMDRLPHERRMSVTCHHCGEPGHKIQWCPRLANSEAPQRRERDHTPRDHGGGPKPLSDVTCYKCGEKGHYANRCTKGHLAFLSQSAHLTQEVRQREEYEQKVQQQQHISARLHRAGEMMR